MKCRYWIELRIAYSLGKQSYLEPHEVKTIARASIPYYHQNLRWFYYSNSQKTCCSNSKIFKEPVYRIYNLIIVQETHGLWLTCPSSDKGPTGINTLLSSIVGRADKERPGNRQAIKQIQQKNRIMNYKA